MYKVFPTGMIRIPLQKQEFYNKDYIYHFVTGYFSNFMVQKSDKKNY